MTTTLASNVQKISFNLYSSPPSNSDAVGHILWKQESVRQIHSNIASIHFFAEGFQGILENSNASLSCMLQKAPFRIISKTYLEVKNRVYTTEQFKLILTASDKHNCLFPEKVTV